MNQLQLFLLGLPRMEYQGRSVKFERRKALALAAYLALSEHGHSRDTVADVLWPDLDHAHAKSALRSTLRSLTNALPISWIEADRTVLRLKREMVWVDVHAFLGLLSTTDSHGHGQDTTCDACAALYREALALYQSDFMGAFSLLDSVGFDDWQLSQREWLRREFTDILRRLSTYYANLQQYDQAIKVAQQWLGADPLHEPAHRQLMRLYAETGQRAEALRQFQQCVDLLEAELATTPEGETIRLYEHILSAHLPVAAAALAPVTASSVLPPLPSLVVGREEALYDLKRRLGIDGGEMRPLTVIQGWPGVGKTTTTAILAHDPAVAQQFPDGILWTSLGENPGIMEALSLWTEALQFSDISRARKIEEMSAQIRARLREKRMLLIVDDIWQAEHALPFCAGGQHCAVILTSRLNDVASALAPTAADLYRLPVLTDSAGLELLSKLSPETVTEYPEQARELVRDLEGLPLAIQVAGRLLHSEAQLGWGIKELLEEMHTGAALLISQPPGDMLGGERLTTPTVVALLKRSTDLLDAETQRRFAYLGLFVPKPATFDLEAMGVVWDLADPRPVARLLVNRGLLEPIRGGRFQMHALLVMHARALLQDEGYRL